MDRCRPYLYMYAHSNELEEKGIVNLNAVNVESNPDMEMLLGVRLYSIFRSPRKANHYCSEKIHVLPFHRVKLLRLSCAER